MRLQLRKPTIYTLSAAVSLAMLPLSAATHDCRLVPDSIRVDGVLDEPAWKQIDTLTLLRNNDPAGGTPGVATKVLVAWGKTNLYVAMIAGTRDIKGLVTQHDGAIYDEDALEMFLDPDGDSKNYLELEWNCLNTSYDETWASPRNGPDLAWAPIGMKNAVKVHGTANKSSDTDTGWVVEIAIPWSAVQPYSKAALPPKVGDKLPLNFYRIDHSGGAEELIAWTPTGVADFHKPDKFGALVFSEAPSAVLPSHRQGQAAPGHALAQRQARIFFHATGGPPPLSSPSPSANPDLDQARNFDAGGRESALRPIPR